MRIWLSAVACALRGLLLIAYHRLVIKLFSASSGWPATPVPNSYWVEPGRFLAGEYPGAARGEKQERLKALLAVGFNSFIDLTGEDELPPYHLELGASGVVHRRFPIVDHGIPSSSGTMRSVVSAVADDLAEGRRVYLHCRAGIGRTGMAVGCYLIHQGLDGSAALEKLQTLWQRCSRARSWPSVPETQEQIRFVRTWTLDANTAHSALDRAHGALLGLVVGEGLAIATLGEGLSESNWLIESKRLQSIATGADTAMTIAAGESLLAHGGHDARGELQRYLAWTQQPGVQMRVPSELKRVLAVWQWSRKPNPGSHDPQNLDPHPLARTLAPVLFAGGDIERAVVLATDVTRTTLQSPLVLDVCRIWAATLAAALEGAAKQELLAMRAAQDALRQRQPKPQITALLQGNWQPSEPVNGAISILASALDIFRFTHSFEAALREAARAGTSTCAALVGALAGAHYGRLSIPPEWLRALADRERLEALASSLVQ